MIRATFLLRRSVLAFAAVAALAATPASAADLIGARETAMGNPNAKVKMIEYASIVCSHCGQFAREVFPAFKRKYIDSGQVYFIFREFPTQPVDLAIAGFLTARCAGPDKYFDVIEALFAGQPALFENGDGMKFLLDAAKVGGMDEAALRVCLNDQPAVDAMRKRVEASMAADHVHSTPTFVIGDKTLEGTQTLAQLDAVIQPLLAAR
jgi:protein-disulfide isomerase